MLKKIAELSRKGKIITGIVSASVVVGGTVGVCLGTGIFSDKEIASAEIETIETEWPECFQVEEYKEPAFVDHANRKNHAFNVADFGKQGSNGWFYRYGKANKPHKSKQIEDFNKEAYKQIGVTGLEVKKDFIQPGEKEAAILEWRAAEAGKVHVMTTYVKNVNGDKNPSYPDGVTVSIYKGEELLETHPVDVKTDAEVLMESDIPELDVEDGESIYFVVNANANNAYDGGLLYAAIVDSKEQPADAVSTTKREDNNANYSKDFGAQGSNGWSYRYGKSVKDAKLVSSKTENGYMNYTSPNLEIGQGFIHPSINDNAIICWEPKNAGPIEIRGTYTKFEQHDGNKNWPDGVTVSLYLNEKLLTEQKVDVFESKENKITFHQKNLQVKKSDKLYFVVNANKNASYDGGAFDIAIIDRNGMLNENSIAIDESETRQNVANVKDDFGEQGTNGWFYQEGYQDEPFGAYNMGGYTKDEKYFDASYLEIKRDFVNTGESGKSAVIKWKVAQDGDIGIDAAYTKLKNEDKNPSWPDGTRVTIYHNNTKLVQEEFEPNVNKEITKDLSVKSVRVSKGDYITMVVNGKANNAYDGGKYKFAIRSLSKPVGNTENNVEIPNDANRTNDAAVFSDFGEQGKNGWFYQYGYNTDPFFAVNVEKYEKGDKYFTKDGIEIKRDFIMPSTKDKSANVKWKVAQDGTINVYLKYTKLKNEDKNPSWPDGVVVSLMHNGTQLKSESFEPKTDAEVTKDLSVRKLKVAKGDYITMIVNGKDNTAYDGGLYSFVIENADKVEAARVNTSDTNRANLENDFGEQGSNGWYYLEGESVNNATLLAQKTDDKLGYVSVKDNGLEMKKDFVQPGSKNHAMYQWVVAKDGNIDLAGSYTKFGHQDGNLSWPDGTILKVYHNSNLLKEETVAVKQGDGNNNTKSIDFSDVAVKKGDYITFEIDARSNNAWDGGRLAVQILPHSDEKVLFIPDSDNCGDLFADFGEQGNKGWYYGFGTSSSDFDFADYNNGEYVSVKKENLLLKKDGVHPSANAAAIYRWIAGADGKIYLDGAYYKSRNENAEDNAPDGVKVEIFVNGTLVQGASYDVPVSKTEEKVQKIKISDVEVKRGDNVDFIVSAKNNAGWDYGKLEMKISDAPIETPDTPEEPDKPDEDGTKRVNSANLAMDFGAQGSNGWYYGMCDWDGNNFSELPFDAPNNRYFNFGKPELKADFVEPGNGRNAAYKWIAAADGSIRITGKYVKFANSEDPNATGVCFRIRQNKAEKLYTDSGIKGANITSEVESLIDLILDVKKDDEILFTLDPEGNDSWDGGRLEINIGAN